MQHNILQLNIESLTVSKIDVVERLAQQLVIVILETHCEKAERPAIPNFSLAGTILSRTHGLATFVHKDLGWTHEGQSPSTSIE